MPKPSRAEARDLCTENVTAFSREAEWTGVMSDDRGAWLHMRQELLTASDVAAVLGHDKRRSALEVYVDKISPRPPELELGLDDPRLWGSVLEQPILSTVARYHGWRYRPGGALLRSRRYAWLGATLDAEIDRGDGLGWLDFEGKTSRLTQDWNEEEQALPTHILIQVQAQLLVTGAPVAVVFALLQGSRPCQVEVTANEELHGLIVEVSEEFMGRVRRLDPPEPDGSESSTRALQRLHPLDDGSVVRLPVEALSWSRELLALRQQQKALRSREDEIKNLLRASIGSATYGVLPSDVEGKRYWRWQLQKRAEHVVRASESRVLLAMKSGPDLNDDALASLPVAPPPNVLEEQLQGSVLQLANSKKKRVRSRR